MPNVLFDIGPLSITLLGVFSALGIAAGMFVVSKEARRNGWEADVMHNAVFVAIIAAVAGARLYYALVFAPQYFLANPSRILAFHEGGLSIQGALLGGMLGIAIFFRVKRRSFWKAADVLAPGVILGQAIGRVGCDVFGVEASGGLFWAVGVGGRFVHPVQLYESMLNYLLFLLLWRLRIRVRREGELFLAYIIGFAFNRFIVEFFRVNPSAFGSLTVAHVTSLAMLAAAAVVLAVRRGFVPRQDGSGANAQVADATAVISESFVPAAAAVAGLMAASVMTYYLIYS